MGLLTNEQRAMAEAGIDPSRLLWAGRPQLGLHVSQSDVLAIPFSLMWGGFAFFWEFMAVTGGAPWFFKLWGIPFVAVGLYFIVGRFFWDAYVREHTFYGLTDDGVAIIRRTGIGASLATIELRRLSEIALRLSSDGSGTIYFGLMPSMLAEASHVFGRGIPPLPHFRLISNASEAFDLCEKQRRAQSA